MYKRQSWTLSERTQIKTNTEITKMKIITDFVRD